VIHGIAGAGSLSFAPVQNKFLAVKALALVALLVGVEAASLRGFAEPLRARPGWRLASAALVVWGIALLGTFSGANFIYFQF